MSSSTVYAQDGVNVEEGDKYSAIAGAVCQSTFNNSPFVEVSDFSQGFFRGPRAFRLKGLDDAYFDFAPDGIGTKVVVIDAAMSHRHASRDLIAMTASDITRWGGIPLVFVNVLDVASLEETGTETNRAFCEMIHGLGEVAHEQNLVCFRGETAELGACVGSERRNPIAVFNWAGCVFGAIHPNRIIDGSTLKHGQEVIALQETSFRSNGLSSVRAALRKQFGNAWDRNPQAADAIAACATPSTLYDNFLAHINGWYGFEDYVKLHLISHISGGGIVGKFAKDMVFPRGLSAELENLFEPTEIMRDVANWRGMPAEECYGTFNCGNGMLVVVDEGDVSKFLSLAAAWGIRAQVAGGIVETPKGEEPTLALRNGFSERTDYLIYS